MSISVLCISASPREEGNSDLLLKEAVRGALAGGAKVEYLSLRDFQISPCVECNACCETGVCRIKDSFQDILEKILKADRLVFATPVFFMSVCSQAKILIDRHQCLWSKKYVLKQPLYDSPRPNRRGWCIAVGGSRSKKMFDSVHMTMHYYFDTIEMEYAGDLFYNQLDEKGAVIKHPTAMEKAYELGEEAAKE